MARDDRQRRQSPSNDRSTRTTQGVVRNLMGQLNMTVYGTDRKSEVETLDKQFQALIADEMKELKSGPDGTSSFLSNLASQDAKNQSMENILNSQFASYDGTNYSAMAGFVQQAYRNRKLQQADTHQVATQLIELMEAISITRDTIISPDAVEGRISRNLVIENTEDDEASDITPVIESVESKFRLQEKIKDFIIPHTLEYGEYFVYVVPYSKIFTDFVRTRNSVSRFHESAGYNESTRAKEFTLLSYVSESGEAPAKPRRSARHGGEPESSQQKPTAVSAFTESVYESYSDACKKQGLQEVPIAKDDFQAGLEHMMGNISVCNESVPLPVLENGFAATEQYCMEFVNEAGDKYVEEKVASGSRSPMSFDEVMKNVDSGVHIEGSSKGSRKSKDNTFKDIRDCYIKMIDPTVMVPIKIMNKTIGYYYVLAENIVPLGGKLGTNVYMNPFEPARSERTVIDAIAEKIVNSFDKDFLKNNIQFKELIVEAITYYNINEKKLKFQYIPVEDVVAFRIDQDENGEGQSMIKKSLFYAKLYLMLLLFKIMTIIVNSNDTKVNYIRQSGLDKNISNKIQEIARVKQARRINMMDLFNYTTLINKVGNGSEMYVPVGRSNERSIETEILQGQDVQLNTELMEMLKNAYILGTGVPAAIVNYLSEADFAKVVEQNNTKFHGRVVNYQLDFNAGCTELYKRILKYSTNLDDEVIRKFKFVLPPPKTVNNQIKNDAFGNFDQMAQFYINLYYPGDQTNDPAKADEINAFRKLLAKEFIPGVNFERVEELIRDAKLDGVEEKVKPTANNGEDDEADMGLDDMEGL